MQQLIKTAVLNERIIPVFIACRADDPHPRQSAPPQAALFARASEHSGGNEINQVSCRKKRAGPAQEQGIFTLTDI
jgi:hypothetical protein